MKNNSETILQLQHQMLPLRPQDPLKRGVEYLSKEFEIDTYSDTKNQKCSETVSGISSYDWSNPSLRRNHRGKK